MAASPSKGKRVALNAPSQLSPSGEDPSVTFRSGGGPAIAKLVLFLTLLALPSSAWAGWVWTAEEGWINPDRSADPSPPELLAAGDQSYEAKEYVDAAYRYELLVLGYPDSQEARSARLKLLDAQFLSEDYEGSLETIAWILANEEDTDKISKALERKYEIGYAYLTGTRRPFLWFTIRATKHGEKILDELATEYPFEDNSDAALFHIGSHYFREDRFAEAEFVYGRLLDEYPQSKWAGPAEYKMGESAMARLKGVEYDLSPLEEAEVRLERYVTLYPRGDKAEDARAKLREIALLRAERALGVATFYLRERRPSAARHYLQQILKEYPNTPVADQAEKLLRRILAQVEAESRTEEEE